MKYPEQEILAIKYERTFFHLLRQLVTEEQQSGAIDGSLDAEDIVRQLTVIFRGALVQWRIDGEETDVRQYGRGLAEAYLNSLKA